MNEVKGSTIREILKGIKVERATADLPQTAASAIFTVSGGRVCITEILGQVTTAIQNQANNTKLVANPDTGTSADMCAVLSTANKEAGTLLGITGTVSDAMFGASAGLVPEQAKGIVINSGTIDLDCAASNTGKVKWTVFYYPIDDGASVTAA